MISSVALISYVLMELIFDIAYTYHMPMGYSGVAISVVILIVVLLAVVSTQIRKVSKSKDAPNPEIKHHP